MSGLRYRGLILDFGAVITKLPFEALEMIAPLTQHSRDTGADALSRGLQELDALEQVRDEVSPLLLSHHDHSIQRLNESRLKHR